MRFSKKLTMIAGAALLCAAAGTAFAGPDPAVVDQVYKMIDKNGDGILQKEEVLAWVKDAYPPGPNGEPAGMMLAQPTTLASPPPSATSTPPSPIATPLPDPPLCSTALFTSEQTPQKTGVPCNGKEGNLLFRTVCNMDGFDTQVIALPAGRAAGCFGVEAITKNIVLFRISVKGGPVIYDSSMGPFPASLIITDTSPSPAGNYTISLDRGRSDPAARVTVRFVDYPK